MSSKTEQIIDEVMEDVKEEVTEIFEEHMKERSLKMKAVMLAYSKLFSSYGEMLEEMDIAGLMEKLTPVLAKNAPQMIELAGVLIAEQVRQQPKHMAEMAEHMGAVADAFTEESSTDLDDAVTC